MNINRTSVATGGTLAALGVLTAVALSAGAGAPTPAQPKAAPPPEVRTEIVHRTIRIRHKRPAAKVAVPVVRQRVPAAAPAPRPPAPLPASVARVSRDDSGGERLDDGRGGGHDDFEDEGGGADD
jgi:hypothetical protein